MCVCVVDLTFSLILGQTSSQALMVHPSVCVVCSSRNHCPGLKVFWGKEESDLMDKWNPFSSKIPHIIFASHLMVRRKKVQNRPDLDIASVIPEIERAVQDYRRAHGNVSMEGGREGGREGEWQEMFPALPRALWGNTLDQHHTGLRQVKVG